MAQGSAWPVLRHMYMSRNKRVGTVPESTVIALMLSIEIMEIIN